MGRIFALVALVFKFGIVPEQHPSLVGWSHFLLCVTAHESLTCFILQRVADFSGALGEQVTR